jgi:hypothetical protein
LPEINESNCYLYVGNDMRILLCTLSSVNRFLRGRGY